MCSAGDRGRWPGGVWPGGRWPVILAQVRALVADPAPWWRRPARKSGDCGPSVKGLRLMVARLYITGRI